MNPFTLCGLALLSICMLNLSSCKREGCTDPLADNYDADANEDDGTCEYSVIFGISAPEAHKEYDLNQTVPVNITVTRAIDMHGYNLDIINTSANDSVVYNLNSTNHSTSYLIQGGWVNDVSAHSDMELILTVYREHMQGDPIVEEVHFHAHPM